MQRLHGYIQQIRPQQQTKETASTEKQWVIPEIIEHIRSQLPDAINFELLCEAIADNTGLNVQQVSTLGAIDFQIKYLALKKRNG